MRRELDRRIGLFMLTPFSQLSKLNLLTRFPVSGTNPHISFIPDFRLYSAHADRSTLIYPVRGAAITRIQEGKT